jgi:hypothetical protein
MLVAAEFFLWAQAASAGSCGKFHPANEKAVFSATAPQRKAAPRGWRRLSLQVGVAKQQL